MTRIAVLTVVLVGAACGSDRTGGPRGAPVAVVRASPDHTLQAGRGRVAAASPVATSAGTVDFAAGRATVKLRGPGRAALEVADPLVVVDMVRGATKIEPFGGAEVRGKSTMQYRIDVDPAKAAAAAPADRQPALQGIDRQLAQRTFYADVFVDAAGRIRRVITPVHKEKGRLGWKSKETPELIVVDFYDFTGER
jgi:hypothetical protein